MGVSLGKLDHVGRQAEVALPPPLPSSPGTLVTTSDIEDLLTVNSPTISASIFRSISSPTSVCAATSESDAIVSHAPTTGRSGIFRELRPQDILEIVTSTEIRHRADFSGLRLVLFSFCSTAVLLL